ncbi:hypothetical protein PJ311_16150 [Bacillus sp. CLL-7-23]|uniref:Uncharacterized protein n=1 Tax=Bacillus changyiensis TaxID=3004103 RepID=A0ABT4X7P1_9BACI|nr:hypothetical protein [Bacillus changyiensis]MDA7028107.1 hypothetical protein [Bacillus changyiensis]
MTSNQEIKVQFRELNEIFNELQSIGEIYKKDVVPAIESLVKTKYYKAGQADEVFKIYRKILEKTLELPDNYVQVQILVGTTINMMKEKDQTLAKYMNLKK